MDSLKFMLFFDISLIWIVVKGNFTQVEYEKLWQADPSVTDMVREEDNLLSLQTESMSYCAAKCTSIKSCRSFFYSDGTRSCIGHDRVPGVEEMAHATGYKMFYGLLRPGHCTDDFSYEPRVDMCYKIYSGLGTTKTANDARVFCEGLSGHLVRIDSRLRYDVLLNDGNFDTSFPTPYFIDGMLAALTEWFLYSNGRNVSLPFDQELWASSEPNRDPGQDMCVALYPDGAKTEWVDHRCDTSSYRYICELSVS